MFSILFSHLENHEQITERRNNLLTFSKELYPKIALVKSAYSFTDRAYIHLDANDTHYIVDITPKSGCSEISEAEFTNEMLCQCVRHEVYQQTKAVRELLAARAMASTVIQQHDSHFEQVPAEMSTEEKAILMDWFDSHDTTET